MLFLVPLTSLWELARIWPHGSTSYSTASFLAQAFLVQGWGISDRFAWNFPSWSVSCEWAAYLIAPWYFYAVLHLRSWALLAVGAVLGAAIATATEWEWFSKTTILPQALLEFLFGAVLSRGRPHLMRGLLPLRIPALALGWASVAALTPLRHPGLFLVAMIWTMLFLSFRTAAATGAWGKLERSAVYLGETSYAVYLCHSYIALLWGGLAARTDADAWLDSWAGRLAAAIVLGALIQALATFLHHLIETPARRFLRALASARPARELRARYPAKQTGMVQSIDTT